MTDTTSKDQKPGWLDLQVLEPLSVAAPLLGTSPDTLKREYPDDLVRVSERIWAMRRGTRLEIAAGRKRPKSSAA